MSDDSTLFESEKERLREALSEEPTNVAVVSEPFAGRETLVDTAVEELDTETRRTALSSVTEADALVADDAFADTEAVCVEGCEYLYTRRIDGFETLERFVEKVASSDATFVVSWNSYAWEYARRTTEVDAVFGEVVSLPTLDAETVADSLASEYDVSEFEDDLEELRQEGDRFVDRLPDRLRFGLEEKSDNVFERITALSGGNLGVARAVFESRLWKEGGEDDHTDLSYEDAFVLSVLVSKEAVGREVLETVVSPRSLETSLRKLSDAEFAELEGGDDIGGDRDGGRVSLRPERLVRAVTHLERRRLVW